MLIGLIRDWRHFGHPGGQARAAFGESRMQLNWRRNGSTESDTLSRANPSLFHPRKESSREIRPNRRELLRGDRHAQSEAIQGECCV